MTGFPPIGTPAYEITPALIDAATVSIRPYCRPTPLLESASLSQLSGRHVLLKCETQQVTGSFKVRGAIAAVAALTKQERQHGVVTASAGNHALGLAFACRSLGVPGLVVLPETVPEVKRRALAEMAIKIRVHGKSYDEAEQQARAVATEAQARFISAFDDPQVIAGNGGTLAREIQAECKAVSLIIAPVGGGGLASGLCAGSSDGRVGICGVNTAASPAMARSISEGVVHLTCPAEQTIAEGLEGGVSPTTAALCARGLRSMHVVSEAALAESVALLARHHGLVIEGSAAAGVALLLERQPLPPGDVVVVVLTGRNIDAARLRTILEVHR